MYVHLGTYDGGIVSFEGEPDSLRPTNNFQASEVMSSINLEFDKDSSPHGQISHSWRL